MFCIAKYDSHIKSLIYFSRLDGSCIVYSVNPRKAMRFSNERIANEFAVNNLRETFIVEVDEQ